MILHKGTEFQAILCRAAMFAEKWLSQATGKAVLDIHASYFTSSLAHQRSA